MGLSRSARISIVLFIDSVFFLVELVTGNITGSLALIADSFHMLNDVLSLFVALYAIKLANRRGSTDQYSYGWHRAEIVGALVNGVFLLALCFNIFLEAVERFFKLPELEHPQLIVIVGALGLLSNILSLFLFHDHGHGHSHSHSHGHGHGHDHEAAQPVQSTPSPADINTVEKAFAPCADPDKSPTSHTPQHATEELHSLPPLSPPALHDYNLTSSIFSSESPKPQSGVGARSRRPQTTGSRNSSNPSIEQGRNSEDADNHNKQSRPTSATTTATGLRAVRKYSTLSGSNGGRLGTANTGRGTFRNWLAFQQAGTDPHVSISDSHPNSPADPLDSPVRDIEAQKEGGGTDNITPVDMDILPHLASAIEPTQGFAENRSPAQSEPEIARAEVESKGSMNMRAVFLHVMGDALGNLGVIVCGLVIWLTHWKHRFVLDPIVSLVITGIIFTSALPLVRSAASILLQGVPDAISLSTVRGALLAIPGVLSVHDLHIWQLSESELVASVHVLAIRPTRSISMVNDSRFSLEEMADGVVVQKHMSLSAEVRNTMYAYGIRSSTVQLEYVSEGSENDGKSSNVLWQECPLHKAPEMQSDSRSTANETV